MWKRIRRFSGLEPQGGGSSCADSFVAYFFYQLARAWISQNQGINPAFLFCSILIAESFHRLLRHIRSAMPGRWNDFASVKGDRFE
jgi:hypothetical protein